MTQYTLPMCGKFTCKWLVTYQCGPNDVRHKVLSAHDEYDAEMRMRKAHEPSGTPFKLVSVKEYR